MDFLRDDTLSLKLNNMKILFFYKDLFFILLYNLFKQ